MKKKVEQKECALCKSKKSLKQLKNAYICRECINATKKEIGKLQ